MRLYREPRRSQLSWLAFRAASAPGNRAGTPIGLRGGESCAGIGVPSDGSASHQRARRAIVSVLRAARIQVRSQRTFSCEFSGQSSIALHSHVQASGSVTLRQTAFFRSQSTWPSGRIRARFACQGGWMNRRGLIAGILLVGMSLMPFGTRVTADEQALFGYSAESSRAERQWE